VKTWRDVEASPSGEDVKQFFLFGCCTDAGSDQTAFRKIARKEASQKNNVIFWDNNCFMHQLNLGVRSGLVLVDRFLAAQGKTFKYFSTLTKIVNLWRQFASAVFLAFAALFGALCAVELARKVPPRCIAGRWGSIEGAEKLVSKIGSERLNNVYKKVLGKRSARKENNKKSKKKQKQSNATQEPEQDEAEETDKRKNAADPEDDEAAGAADGVDEVRIEEMKAFQQRMGRWSREVLSSIADPMFWLVLDIVRIARSPLHHALCFLQHHIGYSLWFTLSSVGGIPANQTRHTQGRASDTHLRSDHLFDCM